MELSEIRTAKAESEEKILKAVSQAMLEFMGKTGLSFEDVYINMRAVPSFLSASKVHIIESVSCIVDYD